MADPGVVDSRGLTSAEVAERVRGGRVNLVPDAPVRKTSDIVRANVFTRINLIIGILFVLILVAGRPKDALFAGVIVSNSLIGIVQELRARRTLNELALLNAPKARVIRDGATSEIGVSQVVADDLLDLRTGDQIVVDGEVLASSGLEIDESLLTGESEPVDKPAGAEVMSGSFVSAGNGSYRATRIGAESYSSKLAEEARRFQMAPSELRRGIDGVLRWQQFIIPPTALLLFVRLMSSDDVKQIAADAGIARWREAVTGLVAATVAMVPTGLVLLTSVALIAGVISLARKKALAKELASVELLARVDTICLDKTGTITTGEISFAGVEPLAGFDDELVTAALGAMGAADPNPNPTLAAIVEHYAAPSGWDRLDATPFSSARKWAGAAFAEQGSWYFGAPDILLGEATGNAEDDAVHARLEEEAARGRRVLMLARSDEPYRKDALPETRVPAALILLEDTIRPDAPETLAFFRDQGVILKVISGDHPQTVAAVAERAGVPGAELGGFDARQLPEDNEALADLLDQQSVFGRVTPHQKRAMVKALQSRGHVVAMTGDGVNDVLALKDADMGIAMGSGSSAARAVAQLVLLDNAYSTLPSVLAEGRRVINNIERVANLFITKTAYAVLLTVLIGISGSPYPFLPRHFTLIDWFSIGIPGFFLALAHNSQLVRPHFIQRVLRFSIPAGATIGLVTFALFEIVRRQDGVRLIEARTAATITMLAMTLAVLLLVSRPLAPWKAVLAGSMAGLYAIILVTPGLRHYFELDVPPGKVWAEMAIFAAVGAFGVYALPKWLPWGAEAD
jgi:cation-transporting ATPase E